MKDKKKVYNFLRIILVIIFVIGVIGIAVFPFDNRSLTLKFVTDTNNIVVSESNENIAEEKSRELCLENIEETLIKELIIYGSNKSMYLKKIAYGEFANYISNVEQGETQWTEEGLLVKGTEQGIRLTMNDSYVAMLKKQSASFLQERLIFIEFFLALIAICFLICGVMEESAKGDNWYNHGPVHETKKFLKDIKKYWQYMVYAAKTDLKAEVANSYLNRLWWLLEPFFNMIVYVVVFGNIMGNSVENYATFVFSALLMWNFFNKTINFSVKLVRNSKDIITKVYIPKFVILLSNMILNMFKLLFSLIVLVVMMIVFRIRIGINILWVFPAYAVMIMLAFGAGMIFLHFGVYVDDLSYAVGILLNMLMFLSGIFYEMMTTLPEPLNAIMMCLNPVAMFVDTMRNALLNNSAANLPILGAWFLMSAILCCIGVHIVYKNENSYVKVV